VGWLTAASFNPIVNWAVHRDEGGTMDAHSQDEDQTIYKVVVNDEEQYSIWPVDRANALGWQDAGPTGLRAACLASIALMWTDMRPRSLRERMAGQSSAA
jgi:MbtH protein